jgi:hypothetical protein
LVHDWIQLPSASQEWNRIDIWIDFDRLKMNHYAFLSVEEANLKAVQNGNPMCTLAMMYAQTAADLSLAAFDKEQDAFFSKEEDTEIHWLLEVLRLKTVSSILHYRPQCRDTDSPSSTWAKYLIDNLVRVPYRTLGHPAATGKLATQWQ